MSNLQFIPKWNTTINQLENGEPISGGEEGLINIAPKQLAENIWWLKDKVEENKTSSDELLIPKTEKGAVNGVATLGANGKVTPRQLPDVIPVAWGNITGNIEDQLDLSELYYTKADVDSKTQILFSSLAHASENGDYYDSTTTAYPNVNIAAGGKLSRSTATFGTAASKNTGTTRGTIPLNDNLGTAAGKNVGTGNNEIPLNLTINSKFDTVNRNIANIVNFTYIGATAPETAGLAVNSVWLDTSTEL